MMHDQSAGNKEHAMNFSSFNLGKSLLVPFIVLIIGVLCLMRPATAGHWEVSYQIHQPFGRLSNGPYSNSHNPWTADYDYFHACHAFVGFGAMTEQYQDHDGNWIYRYIWVPGSTTLAGHITPVLQWVPVGENDPPAKLIHYRVFTWVNNTICLTGDGRTMATPTIVLSNGIDPALHTDTLNGCGVVGTHEFSVNNDTRDSTVNLQECFVHAHCSTPASKVFFYVEAYFRVEVVSPCEVK